jgi:hypothetical protein
MRATRGFLHCFVQSESESERRTVSSTFAARARENSEGGGCWESNLFFGKKKEKP